MSRILIIDDEFDILAALRQIMTLAGYTVVTAMDAHEAMERQRDEPSQIIITDIVMPGRNGLELIANLRSEFPEVKIIAISGGGIGSSQSYLDMAQAMGAVRTFAKPFDPDQLIDAIEELLKE